MNELACLEEDLVRSSEDEEDLTDDNLEELPLEVKVEEDSSAEADLSGDDMLKVDEALKGQELSVRNLIIAAIGVMKTRKARPDTKRICNWIHRRYGKPYQVRQRLRLIEQ